jgi:peptidyl-prolyl cis-trans isomerase D
MLEGIRKATQAGIGRFIMGVVLSLIIVSFVVWGVGDMFRGLTSDKVADVGSTSITVNQFQTEFQNLLYQYQTRSKTPITAAQAHAVGLDMQLLQRMIDEAALDSRARSLGLAMSNETIAEAARSDPKLKGPDGNFSRELFDQALRSSGLTERAFFDKQRAIYLRRQLEFGLVDGLTPPKALVEALTGADAETRAIDYFILPASAAGDITAPSGEALKTFFDERKASFRAPELRAFDMLLVSPSSLAKPAEVSDEDAKAVYDKVKDQRYGEPERRELRQMVFANEGEAAEVAAKIKAGASFDDIAKARNLKDSDTNLGLISKADIFDAAVADAAFALPEDKTSDPVKGRFGYLILEVTKVVPGSVKPFAEVEAEIKKGIATERASGDAQTIHDKIEDARASGKPLAEAAKAEGVEIRSVGPVDVSGRDANGQPVDLPEKDAVLAAVFASDIGADDPPLNTHDRGFLWFGVTKVDPAHDKTFDDVKPQVEQQWRQEQAAKALSAKAADLVKQLDAGAAIADLAKGFGAEVKTAAGITRKSGGELPQAVAVAAFAGPADKAGSAETPEGRFVFKVTKDEVPAFDAAAPAVKSLTDQLTEGLQNSVAEQYIDALKTTIGVSLHERALQMATGG